MRICKRCNVEMIKGFDIKVDGGAYGIKITKGFRLLSKKTEPPRVAICPNCGELSLYIENVDKLIK